MTQFSWKHKIIFGVAMSILHALFLLGIDKITGDIPDYKGIIFQGVVMGVFYVFLFPYIMKRAADKLSKKVDVIAKDIIISPEEIIYDGGANHIKGKEGVGGKLFITNKRILFVSHKFNIQNGTTSINPVDVNSVDKTKLAKIFNSGIVLTLKDNTTYKFSVNNQEEWFTKLNNYIQAA